jgi:hypothetical protein
LIFSIERILHPVGLLYAVATGEPTAGAHRMNEVAVGVVRVLPPFPNSPKDNADVIGVPIHGLTDALAVHFHPAQLQAGEKTPWCSAGD